MYTTPNTARQAAEALLESAANFVDTTNELMTQQLLGLQAIRHLWPEQYEASKEKLLKTMDEHAGVLAKVLQEISQAPGTLMVTAFDYEMKGELAGCGIDTDTGEYNVIIVQPGQQQTAPIALPLIRGHQLSLE